MRTRQDLYEGIRDLQEAAKPYLRNLAPRIPSNRHRIPITSADWRILENGGGAHWKSILESAEGWETVGLPHYGEPVGVATTLYRSTVEFSEDFLSSGRVFLCFRGADYRARVFLNGVFVMEHEGFFAPFEADVTDLVCEGLNTLVVRLDNDNPGYAVYGKDRICGQKLYAATGLGWDNSGRGWNHCPPGMGLYQEVRFETRATLHVEDLWTRPLPNSDSAELRVTVRNCSPKIVKAVLCGNVHGSNFEAEFPGAEFRREVELSPGPNTFRIPLSLPGFRWWTPDEPWLHQAQVTVLAESGDVLDKQATDFGMRTFSIDDAGPKKGRIFLNGEEIRLRGANTMGHEQQCVFRGDLDQLRDDILIAKFGGLNFLRITQRPVQKEIYEACDRLGILLQTDLPLFGKIPRPQFAEGVRQAGEMERLIRPHASCVLVSFINEPSPSWTDTAHLHLLREEFMGFLRACSEIVLCENPDRAIKPIDGDYEPPSPGLPDQHCYCGWYAGHGIDLGKLHRGHWMPTKSGWFYGCGEFGAEGLDPVDLMQRRYPAEWLSKDSADWDPIQIPDAQTGLIYGLWMDAGKNMEDWVAKSQSHQCWVVRLMTRAFRRDRRMVTFALHLLIDAFPSGWMKTVMDCERNPKSAYFEYRDALQPLLVDARYDRWGWWAGELFSAEIWICHDKARALENHTLRYVLESEGVPLVSGSALAKIPSCDSRFQGEFNTRLPDVKRRTSMTLRVALCAPDGTVVNHTEETFVVFPKRSAVARRVAVASEDDAQAKQFLADLSILPGDGAEVIVSGCAEDFVRVRDRIEAGAILLLLELPVGDYDFDGHLVKVEKAGSGDRQFVSRDTGHPAVRNFEPNDFRFWFDPAEDSVTALLTTVLIAPEWNTILEATQPDWKNRRVNPAAACAERKFGRGRIVVCQLKISGRMTANPPAALFVEELLTLERSATC